MTDEFDRNDEAARFVTRVGCGCLLLFMAAVLAGCVYSVVGVMRG